MRLKIFPLALLLIGAALAASVTVVADPTVSPLSCKKDYSDVALHLRITNNGATTFEKGKTVHYAYKSSTSGPVINGTGKLEMALSPGQYTSMVVNPLTAQETPIVQCVAAFRRVHF